MAIAKITRGRKSKRLLKYLLDEKPKKAHEGLQERVLGVSGQNVALGDYEALEAQYETLRELSGKADKNHQIYHVIQSFAKDELDYNSEADVEQANVMGLALAQAIAGSSAQLTVVTQADNESGLLHNHIVVGGVLLDGKSLQTNNVSVKNIRQLNDEVLMQHGMLQHANVTNEQTNGRKTIAEREMNERGEMTKKDMMRLTLDRAMSRATSIDEFEQLLSDSDVALVRGKRKKQDIFKYKQGDDRAMTDRALGDAYGIDSVLSVIEVNAQSKASEEAENARLRAEFEAVWEEDKRKREEAEKRRKDESRRVEVAETIEDEEPQETTEVDEIKDVRSESLTHDTSTELEKEVVASSDSHKAKLEALRNKHSNNKSVKANADEVLTHAERLQAMRNKLDSSKSVTSKSLNNVPVEPSNAVDVGLEL